MNDGAMPMNPLAQHTPPTTSTDTARRPMCGACLRPRSVCICQWVRPVAHTTQVLILQHPQEAGHAKNSARLLHLSLQHSTLLVGEVWDDPDLPTQSRLHTLLLYPSSDTAQPALGMQAASASALLASSTPQPVTPQPDPARQAPLRLVVLDGTWRQSRAMLRLNPWLQRLTRLSLDDVPPSRYAIRKAHKPGQLSTLEATCAALAQLEGDGERFAPLLHAFDGFVASQMAFTGRLHRTPPQP